MIGRVLTLRKLARDAIIPGAHKQYQPAYEASHVLRYMIYVFRSDLSKNGDFRSSIIRVYDHMAKFAFAVWMSKNRVRYRPKGNPLEIAHSPHLFHRQGGWVHDVNDRGGGLCVCLMPPRHGKSMMGSAEMALSINLNHRIQSALTHAVDKNAMMNMRHIAACFKGFGDKEDNPMGRRNLSLFPASLARRDNNESTMRLRCANQPRDPTLIGTGLASKIGGINLEFLWGDDIVNVDEARQPNTRDISSSRWNNQWMRRMQGAMPFVLITATLWHMDDAVGKLVQKIRNGELAGTVCLIPVGGPRERVVNGRTIAPWQAICPELVSSAKLREAYAQMSPYDYSCQYEINPLSDADRVVKRLRMFVASIAAGEQDVPEWALAQAEQHKRFLAGAARHYSIDPAATSKETAESKRKYRADKAGMVYAATGTLDSSRTDQDGTFHHDSQRVVRVLDAAEFYASPQDAAAHAAGFALSNRVDKLHCEASGVGLATLNAIQQTLKLPPGALIRHAPSSGKRARLRDVAIMLDDSQTEIGLPGAVVEFAAVWRGGKVELLDNLKWLWEQVLNYGFVASDHGTDALTQLLKYLSTEVKVGGMVSDSVRAEVEKTAGQRDAERIKSVLDKYGEDRRYNDPWSDDLLAFGGNAAPAFVGLEGL